MRIRREHIANAKRRPSRRVPKVYDVEPRRRWNEITHDIQIDIVDRVITLAPGVRFMAWTLGGSVPGPVVHARVGDRIRFSMTNRSDETMPARPRS